MERERKGRTGRNGCARTCAGGDEGAAAVRADAADVVGEAGEEVLEDVLGGRAGDEEDELQFGGHGDGLCMCVCTFSSRAGGTIAKCPVSSLRHDRYVWRGTIYTGAIV